MSPVRERAAEPAPYCYACGDLLDAEIGSGVIFTERKEWRNVKMATRCSTFDLRRMYFRVPWLWDCFFRVIIQKKKDNIPLPEFHISGVAQMGNWTNGHLIVPWNRDIVLIGKSRRNPDKIVKTYIAYMDLEEQQQHDRDYRSPLGYPIHERCWVLIERIIGTRVVEEHLDLFVEALRQTWHKSKDEDAYGRRRQYGLDGCFSEEDAWLYMERWVGSHELYRNPKKHMRDYEEVTKPTEDSHATRDPVNINEIRDMIDQAARLRLHEETRPKTRQRSRLYQSCADSGPGILPLEVRLNILDFLKDQRDIWNMRIAFHGQWWIPDSYWRARFPGKDIIFEFEELKFREDLDWQYLCLKAEELLENPCHGLRNRRRIMGVLEGTRSLFLQMIDDELNQQEREDTK